MGLFDKAKDLGSKTIEEGRKMAGITKLNIEIGSYENQIEELKTKIGDIVFKTGLPIDGDEAISRQLEEIRILQDKINETKAKINEVKHINICPRCGAKVQKDIKFCSDCGQSLWTAHMEEVKGGKKCPECGAQVMENTEVCPKCGKKL